MPLKSKPAKEFLSNIKVIPQIKKYNNNIHIITGKNSPVTGVYTSSTLGLSSYKINTVAADQKEIRVEIITSYQSRYDKMEDVLAKCADKIIDKSYIIRPGVVFPSMVKSNFSNVTTEHILFTSPFLFPNLKNIDKKNSVITWLMAVAITDKEYDYLLKNSYQQLEEQFEKSNIDIFNINRPSI